MLRGWKQRRLGLRYSEVKAYAEAKKMWGNNIATLIVLNNLTNDHIHMLNSERLMEVKRNSIMLSSFANLVDVLTWLNEVRQICKEAANGKRIEFAGPYQHLNIQKQYEVSLVDFLTKDSYPINLDGALKSIHRIINEISSYLGAITNNQRQYFDLRLSMGLNTVLVFHELILEVMINE